MNNDENENMVYCSRCGAEMKSSSRYCMKCGNLNYDHDANENMRHFLKKKKKKAYEVGSGEFLVDNDNKMYTSVANNTGNKNASFLITYGIYMFIILLIVYLTFPTFKFNLNTLLTSNLSLLFVLFSFLFLFIYCLELTFIKCNKPWWSSLIPFYNLFILAEITFHKKVYGAICFIPIVGLIFLFVMLYKLGEKFQYNGLLTVLFPIIMLPVIGFGTHMYEGRMFISQSGDNREVERDYKFKKIFLVSLFIFGVGGIGLLVYANMTQVKESSSRLKNYYYLFASHRAVSKTRSAIRKDKVSCPNTVFSKDNGTYYIYYSDLGDSVYLPLYYLREPIEAYVKVVFVNGEAQYFVSLTDGEYGFYEKDSKDIHATDVTDFKRLTFDYNWENACTVY